MILKSDFNTLVFNSTGRAKTTPDLSGYFCGMNLSTWRQTTKALLSFCVKISNYPDGRVFVKCCVLTKFLSETGHRTKADTHTEIVAMGSEGGGKDGGWNPDAVLERARKLLFDEP